MECVGETTASQTAATVLDLQDGCFDFQLVSAHVKADTVTPIPPTGYSIGPFGKGEDSG